MTSRRVLLVVLTACFALGAGCRGEGKSDAPAKTAAPAELPPPAPAGQARRIDITVDDKGYHPPAAPARAGEKLVLAFTRTAESECVNQVIVDGKTTDLPLNKPVEIATTMPATGDLVFTCGMKMFEGRVAVAPQ
jgi:hypothetical protein